MGLFWRNRNFKRHAEWRNNDHKAKDRLGDCIESNIRSNISPTKL